MANSLKGCLRTSPTLARSASSARMLIPDAVAGEGTASSQRRSSACALAGSTHFPHRAPHGASPVFSTCAKLKGTHLKKSQIGKNCTDVQQSYSTIKPNNKLIFFSFHRPNNERSQELVLADKVEGGQGRKKHFFILSTGCKLELQMLVFLLQHHLLQCMAPLLFVSLSCAPSNTQHWRCAHLGLRCYRRPAHRALNNLASRINQSIDIHNIE